ncbi:hypothetical protein OBBRIDRAFT_584527 [Obba rivulosa]|uniref:Ribosomal RNA-processing protein 8 n=1 Tax=Obba rivulosa TaxID=1052685 RepID=A0A8E2ATK8_9APHY|nr:hypothetical protein OBBRIDRAFT_584527 [Obba rivulosa]
MALFDVPGWSVPSEPVAQASSRNKKRKRPGAAPAEDDANKMRAAQVNVEKLMEKLDDAGAQGAAEPQTRKKRKRNLKSGEGKKGELGQGGSDEAASSTQPGKQAQKKAAPQPQQSVPAGTKNEDGPSQEKKKKRGRQKEKGKAVDAPAPSVPAPKSKPQPAQGLTALQANMKNSLDGARFRWINEILYKSDSEHAHQLMRENPNVFSEYHTGFRHQVHSWPTNPVAHYVSALSSYPPKTVIVDLGCGDAALARALVPKGMTVLSFDLVSDGAYVVEADTCARLPLPGSEEQEAGGGEGEGEGAVVDVVVCALSLMGTNWPRCIREAWRVLQPGGELKIAEVASRFTDVDDFASLVNSIGFRLKSKDDSNTHFTLFEFKKTARKPKSEKEWEGLLSRGSILKPCEYKRR